MNRWPLNRSGFENTLDGMSGFLPPSDQWTLTAGRHELAGWSHEAISHCGQVSGLGGEPVASQVVGNRSSRAQYARSIMWLPMSPTCPPPKSQNRFQDRHPLLRYSGL